MTQTRRAFLTTLAPALAAAAAQTLAHPGWHGNGIATERWWQDAVVVQEPADMTFAQAMTSMDAVGTAGADTLLLPDLQPEQGGTAPFASRFGSMDALDALLREASARRMHVLLTAPLLRLANDSGELRFWLARGIAGFSVGTLRPADVDTLHVLRAAVDRYPGQRLLLTSLDSAAGPEFAVRFTREFHPPTLRLFLNPSEATGPTPTITAAVATANPTAPLFKGLLPVVPLAALETEAGMAATQQLRANSRTRQAGFAVRHRH